MTPPAVARPPARIVRTDDAGDLRLIEAPDVQAVVYVPSTVPEWMERLGDAVRGGCFRLDRTTVEVASPAEAAADLSARLPAAGLDPVLSRPVVDDVVDLVDRLATWTRCTRFLVRLLTAAPTLHCGYHVDTVPPGAPRWGLLRVYNGVGTAYVDPRNVVSASALYRYMSRRERLARDLGPPASAPDGGAPPDVGARLRELDTAAGFLRVPDDVALAPAGSIVAFRHLDASLHWSDHDPSLAWVHASPADGDTRFVVNVTPVGPARARGRPRV